MKILAHYYAQTQWTYNMMDPPRDQYNTRDYTPKCWDKTIKESYVDLTCFFTKYYYYMAARNLILAPTNPQPATCLK